MRWGQDGAVRALSCPFFVFMLLFTASIPREIFMRILHKNPRHTSKNAIAQAIFHAFLPVTGHGVNSNEYEDALRKQGVLML